MILPGGALICQCGIGRSTALGQKFRPHGSCMLCDGSPAVDREAFAVVSSSKFVRCRHVGGDVPTKTPIGSTSRSILMDRERGLGLEGSCESATVARFPHEVTHSHRHRHKASVVARRSSCSFCIRQAVSAGNGAPAAAAAGTMGGVAVRVAEVEPPAPSRPPARPAGTVLPRTVPEIAGRIAGKKAAGHRAAWALCAVPARARAALRALRAACWRVRFTASPRVPRAA